jgi:ABC-type hemin transport system ATPase subunit
LQLTKLKGRESYRESRISIARNNLNEMSPIASLHSGKISIEQKKDPPLPFQVRIIISFGMLKMRPSEFKRDEQSATNKAEIARESGLEFNVTTHDTRRRVHDSF